MSTPPTTAVPKQTGSPTRASANTAQPALPRSHARALSPLRGRNISPGQPRTDSSPLKQVPLPSGVVIPSALPESPRGTIVRSSSLIPKRARKDRKLLAEAAIQDASFSENVEKKKQSSPLKQSISVDEVPNQLPPVIALQPVKSDEKSPSYIAKLQLTKLRANQDEEANNQGPIGILKSISMPEKTGTQLTPLARLERPTTGRGSPTNLRKDMMLSIIGKRFSSPNVSGSTPFSTIMTVLSAKSLLETSPRSLVKLFPNIDILKKIAALSFLDEVQFRLLDYASIINDVLKNMTSEAQFISFLRSQKGEKGTKRVIELVLQSKYNDFKKVILSDESARKELLKVVLEASDDQTIYDLSSTKSKDIVHTIAFIKEILEYYKAHEDPKHLCNIVLFVKEMILTFSCAEVLQANHDLKTLSALASAYEPKLDKILEERQKASQQPVKVEELQKAIEIDVAKYAFKLKKLGEFLKKFLDESSDQFFALEIINFIDAKKHLETSDFSNLCLNFSLAYDWFTNTHLLLRTIEKVVATGSLDKIKPLLAFLLQLVKNRDIDNFSAEEIKRIEIICSGQLKESQIHNPAVETLKIIQKRTQAATIENQDIEKKVSKSEKSHLPFKTLPKGPLQGSISRVFKSSPTPESVMAFELRQIFGSLIKKITLGNFTRTKWQKNIENSPQIHNYLNFWKQAVNYFTSQILSFKEPKERAKYINFLIDVLKISSENDFSTTMLLTSVLSSRVLTPLRKTKELVDKSKNKFFEEIQTWILQSNRILREKMKENKDSIPHVVILLQDLITLYEATPNIFNVKYDDMGKYQQDSKNKGGKVEEFGMISLNKVEDIANFLKSFRVHQQRIIVDTSITRLEIGENIAAHKTINEDELEKMADALESKK